MSEAKSRSDERLSGRMPCCPDAEREDGKASDEVNRVVVRAKRMCLICKQTFLADVSRYFCDSCVAKHARRAERGNERSGPDNTERTSGAAPSGGASGSD